MSIEEQDNEVALAAATAPLHRSRLVPSSSSSSSSSSYASNDSALVLENEEQLNRVLDSLNPEQTPDEVADLLEQAGAIPHTPINKQDPPRLFRRGRPPNNGKNGAGKPAMKIREAFPESLTDGTYATVTKETGGTVAIFNERPEHSVIAYLKAQGKSNEEIFVALGGEVDYTQKTRKGRYAKSGQFTYDYILAIQRQPWFVHKVEHLQHEAGMDPIQQFLAGECSNSLRVLVELRDLAESESVRKAAADSLIDRAMGKAVQRVETKNTTSNETPEDLQKQWDELAARRKHLESLTNISAPSASPLAIEIESTEELVSSTDSVPESLDGIL